MEASLEGHLSHDRSSSLRADAASAAYEVLRTTCEDAAAAAVASDHKFVQEAAASALSKVARPSMHVPASSSDGFACGGITVTCFDVLREA